MRRSPVRPRVGQAPHLRGRGPDLMRPGGDVPETWPVDGAARPACCGCGTCTTCCPCRCGACPHAAFPGKAPCGASPTPTRPWPRPDAVGRRRSRNLACGCVPCSACCGCGLAPHAAFPRTAPCGASPTPTVPWPRPDAVERRRSRNLACGCGLRSACSIRGLLRMLWMWACTACQIRGLLRVLWMRACTARLPCRCGACPACGVPRQGPVWGKPHTHGAVAPT